MLSFIQRTHWLLGAIIMLAVRQGFGHGMSEAEKQTIIDGGYLS